MMCERTRSTQVEPVESDETGRPAFSFGPLPPERVPLRHRIRRLGLHLIGRRYPRAANRGMPQSILLVRPDHVGDMLFLTPGLHWLRSALPQTKITLLAGPWSAAVMANNPDVDRLITFPFPGFERVRKAGSLAPYRALFSLAAVLRDDDYDAAVILRNDHWWGAWVAAAAGIPRRVGYDLPDTIAFLTEAIPYEPTLHEVRQNARLLHKLAPSEAVLKLGQTSFPLTAEDERWANRCLAEIGSTQGPLIAIHPGAGASVKQWSTDRWSIVATYLHDVLHRPIVLTGSENERVLTRSIAMAVPGVVDLAGQTTLGQLGALFARCGLVLGSDSGPAHLAAAVGTPTLTLYGPVSPEKFGPWGDPSGHTVLSTDWQCAPCNRLDWPDAQVAQHGCVRAITPAAVLTAAERLLVVVATGAGTSDDGALANPKERS